MHKITPVSITIFNGEGNKERYKLKIIKVFNNPGDKILYEAFLHQYFNVKLHNNFWNESNQTPFGYDTTGKEPWNKGLKGPSRIFTKEHILNLTKSRRERKNYFHTQETKDKISKSKKELF